MKAKRINREEQLKFIMNAVPADFLNTTIQMLNDTISRQQAENDNLKAELAWFKQKMIGSSSERRIDDIAGQLSLFGETTEEKTSRTHKT